MKKVWYEYLREMIYNTKSYGSWQYSSKQLIHKSSQSNLNVERRTQNAYSYARIHRLRRVDGSRIRKEKLGD